MADTAGQLLYQTYVVENSGRTAMGGFAVQIGEQEETFAKPGPPMARARRSMPPEKGRTARIK
jgi:hypothetical protein